MIHFIRKGEHLRRARDVQSGLFKLTLSTWPYGSPHSLPTRSLEQPSNSFCVWPCILQSFSTPWLETSRRKTRPNLFSALNPVMTSHCSWDRAHIPGLHFIRQTCRSSLNSYVRLSLPLALPPSPNKLLPPSLYFLFLSNNK